MLCVEEIKEASLACEELLQGVVKEPEIALPDSA